MDGHCDKHPFELSEARCRECGNEFCTECLVHPFGPSKPPFCIPCAIAMAGVRTTAGRPHAMSRRELKREAKAERKAAKLAAKHAPDGSAAFGGDPFADGAAAPSRPAAPSTVHLEFTISDDGQIIRDGVPARR